MMVMMSRVRAMARRGGLLVAGFEAFGFQGLKDIVKLVGEIRPGNFISLDAFAECKSCKSKLFNRNMAKLKTKRLVIGMTYILSWR